jgi:hypothetical protein
MSCLQLTVFGRILMSNPGINVYDIRKECVGPLCYDFSDADKYLNRSASQVHEERLHGCGSWLCSSEVPVASALTGLLHQSINACSQLCQAHGSGLSCGVHCAACLHAPAVLL